MSNERAPVTFEDVRDAIQSIAGGDPNATNAGAIRKALGERGSLATIQRHLGPLREQVAAATAVPDVLVVPPPPMDEMLMVWRAAYNAAHGRVLARTEVLAHERDAAIKRATAAEADRDALAQTCDDAEEQRAAAQGELEAMRQAQAQAKTTADTAAEVAADELRREREAHTQEVSALKLAVEREQFARQTEFQTQQATIDRLNEKVAELRSLLAQLRVTVPDADPKA